MANFVVAASPETIEKANKIMEIYAQNGDKKEDTLLRILDLAEAESVKGTHPALEPNLKAIFIYSSSCSSFPTYRYITIYKVKSSILTHSSKIISKQF